MFGRIYSIGLSNLDSLFEERELLLSVVQFLNLLEYQISTMNKEIYGMYVG